MSKNITAVITNRRIIVNPPPSRINVTTQNTRIIKVLDEAPVTTINNIYQGALLKTMQLTSCHVGDDGDNQIGITPSYTVRSTGVYSGTCNVDLPHYAAATISFNSVTKQVLDSANGLVTVLASDKIRIRGGANDGAVLTVTVGATAGSFTVSEAIITESAGAYITLCKRATPLNAVVDDLVTGRCWLRASSHIEKIGPASNGKLSWYDATKSCIIHPAAADLQMIAATKQLKIVNGVAEASRYFVGGVYEFAGFANAINNKPGYRCDAVTVTGSDLFLTLWTSGRSTLISEAAGGSRSIKLVTQSIFAYCAAANAAALGGYSDWRIPEDIELRSLCDMPPPNALPNATAFPVWSAGDYYWSSVTHPYNAAYAMAVHFYSGFVNNNTKNALYYCSLVRGV